MINNYIKAKEIVSSKYNEDYHYYSMLVLGVYSLLSYYPNYHNIITEVFSNTNIIISKDSVLNILDNNGYLSLDFVYENQIEDEITYGLSSYDYSFSINDNNHVRVHKGKPFLICNSRDTSPTVLLNVFIHEANHLIKGYIDTYGVEEELDCSSYYVRSGLSYQYSRYLINDDVLEDYYYYTTLDEVINSLQTTDMMKLIKEIDGIIPDEVIQNYLDSLDKDEMDIDFGYEACVSLFRPLWENDTFKNIINNSIVEGKISDIISNYDTIMGEGSFEYLGDLVDLIDEDDAIGRHGRMFESRSKHLNNIIIDFIGNSKVKCFTNN